jgi:RNA polymerase sigma-70 factor, ECF subfamily
VFLVAFRRLPEFQGQSSMSTWLYGIALRVVRLHRRTAKRASLHGAIDLGSPFHEDAIADVPSRRPDAAAETADAYRMLLHLLDQLDDDKREIFVLAELDQLPIPQVADLLGLKLNTAYSRLRLARAAFDAAWARAGRCR